MKDLAFVVVINVSDDVIPDEARRALADALKLFVVQKISPWNLNVEDRRRLVEEGEGESCP